MTNEQLHEIIEHVVMYGRYQFESANFNPESYFIHLQKMSEAVKEFTKIKELLNKYVTTEKTTV